MPRSTHQDTLDDIQETLGHVPTFLSRLPEAHLGSEWRTMKDFQLQDTAIPMKYKELMGLAVASALQCPYCTYFHEQAARANGASDEEVREAVFQAKHTGGWSSFVRGTGQSVEEFRAETDRIIEHMTGSAPQAHR